MINQALHQIARSLAAELSAADFPHLWRAHTSRREWWVEIRTDDAWLMIQHSNGRYTIASDKPREMKHAGTADRITVDASRKPEAIARDIVHRLLPDARAYFQRCHAYTRKDKEERATHAAILASLEPFKQWSQTNSDGRRTDFRTERARLDIYSTKVYSLTIDSPSMEEVQTILQLLERTSKQNDYNPE